MISATVQYRLGGFGLDTRLVIFVLFALSGAAIQILSPGSALVGLLVMALPLPLLAAKPWTNKPKDLGEEEWTAVGSQEFDRLSDAFRAARKTKPPFFYRPAAGLPVSIILFFLALSFSARPQLAMLFLDAAVLLWPALHFLKIRVWVPRRFSMVITALEAALSYELPSSIVVTPYLRLDRDAEGQRIPEDARLMLESRRKVADLVGVQLQVAINKGPKGEVPYLYAVVICKGQGSAWSSASRLDSHLKGYEVEAGGDDQWGTVVIRQKTTGGGYETDLKDCRRLAAVVCSFLLKLSPEGKGRPSL